MTRGILFLISAPSGGGKTSLVNAMFEKASSSKDGRKLCVSVSHTTRPQRPGEEDGKNYHFVSDTEFHQLRSESAFLESAEVFGNLYGTSKAWVEERLETGLDVILEIDWQGASQVQALLSDAVSIFILPPSLDSLRQRLTNRGQDDASVIEQRMAEAVNEITHLNQANFIVINDSFDTALSDLEAVIRSAHLSKAHQLKVNEDLLNGLLSQ
ncbi:MAG: guanylate kinase [Gammaproteobacteria bacterium]|nr:guanylate kinase [Gammaproteobacteria bacterium]